MKIKRATKNAIKVYSSEASVFISTGKGSPEEENAFYLGENTGQEKALMTAGEYEYGVVEFIILEVREKREGKPNLYKIIMDDVHLLYVVDAIGSLDKTATDLVGQVDVVLFAGKDVEAVEQIQKKFGPGKMIVFDYTNEQLDSLGLSVEEGSPTINVKSSDFGNEEQSIELIGLK